MWFRCPGFLHRFTQKLKKLKKKLPESLENLIQNNITGIAIISVVCWG